MPKQALAIAGKKWQNSEVGEFILKPGENA
jgi:hypothetical protein